MIDCAVSYNAWNVLSCYILLLIDIKEFVTDDLYLINFLLGSILAMIIVFLLVLIITSQEIVVKFFHHTMTSTLQYRIGEFLYFNLKYNVVSNSILLTFGKFLITGLIVIINGE